MKYQLEKKTYSRKEFAEIANLDVKDTNHFKRNVENYLNHSCYGFDENMRKGITILSQPATAREKLTEILYRFYDIDVRIDVDAFACFLYCMINDVNSFQSCPWEEREKYLKASFKVDVKAVTLKRWNAKLIEKGVIYKSLDKAECTYWYTDIFNDKERIRVSKDNDNRIKYWKDFWNRVKNGETDFMRDLIYTHGGCYYSCRRFVPCAYDEQDEFFLNEICRLVEEIQGTVNEVKSVCVQSTKIIEVSREDLRKQAEQEEKKILRTSQGIALSDADGNFNF